MYLPCLAIRRHRRAFTLVELLVVMGVILILASIVVGIQRSVYYQQSQAKAKSDLQAIAVALESFKLRYGDYPWLGPDSTSVGSTAQGEQLFRALTGQSILTTEGGNPRMINLGASQTAEPFLEETSIETAEGTGTSKYFVDPWGSPYRYYYYNDGRDVASGTETWNHSGFILLSAGPDRSFNEIGTAGTAFDFTTGIFPTSADQYYGLEGGTQDENSDNIVYGLQDM